MLNVSKIGLLHFELARRRAMSSPVSSRSLDVEDITSVQVVQNLKMSQQVRVAAEDPVQSTRIRKWLMCEAITDRFNGMPLNLGWWKVKRIPECQRFDWFKIMNQKMMRNIVTRPLRMA